MDYNYNNQYHTTSYGAQGGNGGGGFLNQHGSQGGSQNSPGGSASKTYGKDTLRPVTIKQVLDAQQPHPDAEFKIDGTEITQVTFVGQIRNISTQTTNITYKLDDGTGLIEVKQWTDLDTTSMDGQNDLQPKLIENAYARVWGRLKAFNNKRHVGAHVIRPIQDLNEIQYHLLEATTVHLYFARGPPEHLSKGTSGGMNPINGAYGQPQNTYGEGTEGALGATGRQLPPMSGPARKVFTALGSSPQSNEGMHAHQIAAQLGMQVNDVMKAGDELLGIGVIFTTVDDETWAVLEF
ncbi:MAG: replication factor A protein 2 [Pycnora praestabilis]|nr:MAG: replication factor A protein 2 [Pycnora praestabilis]